MHEPNRTIAQGVVIYALPVHFKPSKSLESAFLDMVSLPASDLLGSAGGFLGFLIVGRVEEELKHTSRVYA